MKKVKYKGKYRSIDSTDNVVTEEPDINNLSPQLSQNEMENVRELIIQQNHEEALKGLYESANRHDKAGDEKEFQRAMRRIAIYKKSMQK